MSLADVVIGLKAYKEVDNRMAVLWKALDQVLICPRIIPQRGDVPTIRVENVSRIFCDSRIMLT